MRNNIAHALCMLDNEGKNIDTHLECVILIAFPQQWWFCDRFSMLHLYAHGVSSCVVVYRLQIAISQLKAVDECGF
jgi:hypothetical protein